MHSDFAIKDICKTWVSGKNEEFSNWKLNSVQLRIKFSHKGEQRRILNRKQIGVNTNGNVVSLSNNRNEFSNLCYVHTWGHTIFLNRVFNSQYWYTKSTSSICWVVYATGLRVSCSRTVYKYLRVLPRITFFDHNYVTKALDENCWWNNNKLTIWFAVCWTLFLKVERKTRMTNWNWNKEPWILPAAEGSNSFNFEFV